MHAAATKWNSQTTEIWNNYNYVETYLKTVLDIFDNASLKFKIYFLQHQPKTDQNNGVQIELNLIP